MAGRDDGADHPADEPGFKVREAGPLLGAQLGDLRREPRVEVRNLGEAGSELIGGDVVALFEAVVDRLGDDLGLIAVDAAGVLLGDGERVEHAGSLTMRPPRAQQPLASCRFRSTSRRSRSSLIDDYRAPAPETLARCS